MTEETIGGAAASKALHCSEKFGGTASPACSGTGGPQELRKFATRASCSLSRLGGGSGIQRLIWKGPLVPARTSLAQALISSGFISSAPQAPSPPAFATAIDSEGALAPAMGASKIGVRKPNLSQNACARCSGDFMDVLLELWPEPGPGLPSVLDVMGLTIYRWKRSAAVENFLCVPRGSLCRHSGDGEANSGQGSGSTFCEIMNS